MKPTQNSPEAPFAESNAAAGVLAFPASIAQQMFWYLELLEGEVTAFNVPLRFKLDGPVDLGLLERSVNTIIERHEALRTRFGEDQGELLQIVIPELKLQIPLIDISHLPANQVQDEADRLGSLEAQRPFHLATGPLIRAELIKLAAESFIFHLTVHHALFDGMSMTVLTTELATLYQAYFDGHPCPLDPLPIQYGDYSVWQKDFLESPEMKQQLGYWKKRLEGMTELDLPTDFPRPPVKSWKGEIISTLLPKELTDQLQSIAASQGATLFHLQLAAYMVLLHRYTGSLDIAVGTPVTGRTREELEGIIGVFINSLILRCDLSGNPSFQSFLGHVRETALEALENQELPFECLVRELRPNRDPSRNPLFQVNFNHHRSFAQAGSFGGVTLTPIPSRSPGTIFDLHFFMVERREGWRASCDYSTDLFKRSTAERMLGHFKQILESIAAHPESPVTSLEILTEAEKQQLAQVAGIPKPYPRESTIGQLFLNTANHFAGETALVSKTHSYSYSQLKNEAQQIAQLLLSHDLKPGAAVALTAASGPEMIAAMIGILLAGGCIVPIDPSYPADRFALLLGECEARLGLTTPDLTHLFSNSWPGKTLILPEFGHATDAPFSPVTRTAEQAAQLLFTSGSTGRPKGVLIPHRGIIRLVKDNDFISIQPKDVFLQAAPVSFDASLLEIWGPLLNGGKLVLLPDGPGLEAIANAVQTHHVTTLWLTAGLFQLMIDEHASSLKGLRYLLAGGDVLSVPHVRKAMQALPDTILINGYGPTENTTFTTCHHIRTEDLDQPSIPIGKPICNTTVHLLDEHGRKVPIGIPGELCTGGDGLALGYLHAPELTAEKFITHPEFGRLYRTGDLCKQTPDGILEFIGRRDHQVKVRGFRIELGEIESILCQHPAVKLAKAAVRGDSAETKRILAWIVPEEGQHPDVTELQQHLARELPAFMRPDAMKVIDSLPLNANGKVNTAALPDPDSTTPQLASRPFLAPVGDTETRLAEIWKELLGMENVGRDQDFFALGGHSLMALRMFSRISREWNVSLPLSTLLHHPTVQGLASMLETPATPAPHPAEPATDIPTEKLGHVVRLRDGGSRKPVFCLHGGDGGVIFYREFAKRLPEDLPIYAIESAELGSDRHIQPRSVRETASSYVREILTAQPDGPYRIAGYSYGGVLAQEIACILRDLGRTVEFVGLFDTHCPAANPQKLSKLGRLQSFWNRSTGAPLLTRVHQLTRRIIGGIRTNLRIRAEIQAAQSIRSAEPFSDLRRVQVREENWRAMQAHVPRVFDGTLILFQSEIPSDKFQWPDFYGWACFASQGVSMVPVSGEHLTLFDPENVEELSRRFHRALPQS